MITAMILAGGIGSRVGANRPKQFVEVFEKPIIVYTLEIFQNHEEINNIAIVCHRDWINFCTDLVKKYHITKVEWIIEGGKDFQESCKNGVEFLTDKLKEKDYLLVQYAASPFTSRKIVDSVIEVMKQQGAAISAIPCYQLLGSNDANSESKRWVDRDACIQITCPYGFRFGYIKGVYNRAMKAGILDCVEPHTTSLIYELGDTLYQAYGDQTNIKITTQEDIELFTAFCMLKKYREDRNE